MAPRRSSWRWVAVQSKSAALATIAGAMPSCSGVGMETGRGIVGEPGASATGANEGVGVGSSRPLARKIGRGVADCCARTRLEDGGAGAVWAGRPVHVPGEAIAGTAGDDAGG